MKFLFIFLALCFSSVTNAALINNDYFTTDTNSRLDWLDVSLTLNKSYYDVSSQLGSGGEFEGWRYATSAELNSLVLSVAEKPYSYSYGDFPTTYFGSSQLFELVELFGAVHFVEEGGYTAGLLADGPTSFDSDYYHKVAWIVTNLNDVGGHKDYLQLTNGGFWHKLGSNSFGSYLVRDTAISAVPLPSSILLFTPLLIGLVGLRRKG